MNLHLWPSLTNSHLPIPTINGHLRPITAPLLFPKVLFHYTLNLSTTAISLQQQPVLCVLKGSIFLKNRHFIIQERFIKFIYGINTIIKCDISQPVKFQIISGSWTGSKLNWFTYRISELMLPTFIQRYVKNHFIFDPVQTRETNRKFTGCEMPHFMIILIPYINLLNLSWIMKCPFLRNTEPLRIFSHGAVHITGAATSKHVCLNIPYLPLILGHI